MAAAERVVTEIVIDASDVTRAERLVTGAFDHMGDRSAAAQARMQASLDQSLQIFGKNMPQAVERVGAAYERLRGKLDPVFAAQVRMEREMVQSLGIINRAVLLHETTEEQATRDIIALKKQQIEYINRVRDAQQGANDILSRPANDNNARFRRQNLTYQLFDVGQMAALGQNPAMTAMQQGPQILQLYAGQGGINAALKDAGMLAGSFATRLGPIAVVAGAGALAINEMQNEIEAATGKSVSFGDVFKGAISVIASDIDALLKPAIDLIAPGFDSAWSAVVAGAKWTGNQIINSFEAAYDDVIFVWNGFPKAIEALVFGGLNAMVGGIQTMIQTGAGYIDSFVAKINQAVGTKINPIGKLDFGPMLQNDAADEFFDMLDERNRKLERTMSRDRIGDYFKSVRDRVSDNLGEDFSDRPGGIPHPTLRGIDDQPGSVDFYQDLTKSTTQRLNQLEEERRLLGLTGAAAAAFRYEQDGLNQAIAKNIELNPEQLAGLKKQADEYGRQVDLLAKDRLRQDAIFDRNQLGRNDMDAEIASRLHSADQPIDFSSQEAGYIRANLLLERQVDLWHDIRDSGMDAIDQIVDSGLNGFKGIGDVAKDIGSDLLKEFTELAVKNPIKNMIYDAGLPTLDTAGGVGGFFKSLFGGDNPAAKAVASMDVQAATVIVNGSIAGSVSDLLGDNFKPTADGFMDMLRGKTANDNTAGAPVIPVTRAPLGDIAAARREALSMIESGGNYGAIGPTDPDLGRALGKYQVMEANIGPWSKETFGRSVSADEFLSSKSIQDAIVDKKMAQYTDLYGDRGAGQAWFGGPGSVGKNSRTDVLGTSVGSYGDQYVNNLAKTSDSLDKVTTSAIQTSQGLAVTAKGMTNLGGGMDTLGSALSKFPAAPTGGGMGGIGGFFSKLFGGGGLDSAFSGTAAYSAISDGGFVGLFHDGRYPGNPGSARLADPSWFINAPRYHSGRIPSLAPDEEPAILRRNEPVFRSMDHARQVVGANSNQRPVINMTRVIHNNAGVNVREEQSEDGNGNMREDVYIDRMLTQASKRGSFNKTLSARGAKMPSPKR